MNKHDWDIRFLDLAEHVAKWSKDPSTKVGAVLVRPDRTIASVGYNGFPRGCNDNPELYDNRPIKYLRTVHAELNAILSAREPLANYTLYVTPLHPCADCAGVIIQAGIKRVIFRTGEYSLSSWGDHFEAASNMFVEAGIVTSQYPTR